MAQCRRVRRCTLTDVVPATLDNLRDNAGKLPPTAAPCRVARLDWCAPQAFLDAEERAPDLILGADLVYEPALAAPLATTLDALLSRAAREARAGARPRALVACVPARSIGPGSQHPGRPLTAPAALPLAPGCPRPEQCARGAPVPCPRSPHPPRLATQGVRRTETWDLFVSELEAHGLAHADCTAEAHAAMEADDCPFWCAADEVARVRLLEVRWPEHRS